MNYSNLRTQILATMKYPPKITAQALQEQLINIVNGLDLGALLLGVATPSLTPNTEANGFYFGLQPGTYTNFPTINGETITVDSSEVAIIVRSGNYWSKIHITTYPTIDPTTKHWMIGNEDTGVLAEGTTPHIDQESGNWMIGTYDTGIHAQGAPGKDAYQPFKGTFASVQDLNAAYPEPNDGDTAYVEDTVDNATVLKVYDVVNGEWHDTGTTADSPVFGSGQFLSSVKIDDTQLDNPADGSLPKAEDVMQLKAKLGGVTASEVKVQLITSNEGQNVFAGKVVGGTGDIDHSGSNDANYKYVEFEIPSNVKSIRFMTPSGSGWSAGWAIGHYSEGDFVKDRSSAYVSGREFTVEVKEGETHFRTNCYIMYGTPQTDRLLGFYCYLQSGKNVGEELKGKVNVADMAGYASIVKNLFDKDTFIKGRYVTNVSSSWTSNTNGIMSQPLYLDDGVEYTVSNVCMRYYPNGSTSTTGSDPEHAQVLLLRFDENDNPIDIQSYPAVEDVISGGGYYRNRGHATFTFNKGNEHHCRFLVNANVQWSQSYLQNIQLEVGSQVTSYAQYGEVMTYDLVKKSEINSIIEEQMQPLEEEVDSISDSLVRSTFELQETSEVVPNHFWHVGDSTQPRTSQNINILEYEYEEGYDYRFSGRMNYNQNYYCIAYLDTNKNLISLQYKGETNGVNIWDDKPLTIPQGTAYICLQQSKYYKNTWKLEKQITEKFDFDEMLSYLVKLYGRVTDNETSIRSLKNKLMKVSISDGQIIVRSRYSENDDFLLLMKLYDSRVQSLTFDSYYIADKDMEDDDIISSNELKIGNIRDSIGAIGTNFGWLFAQHGWSIPIVPIGSNTVNSEDVGSIWESNGKRFILGHYSDYIYMFPECTYNDSLQVWEPSWAHDGITDSPYNDPFPTTFTHVSGAIHADPITGGSSDYRVRVQLSERKYIVDGVEVGNGVYYCDDFTFDEFVKGINPAKVDPTYFIGSTAQSNIDWSDENLMLKFGRSFSFKGMSVNYHQFIDCVNPFLVRLYYGCIPRMPLKRIETFEDESSVTYNSYTFIPKVKAVKNTYPVCRPFPSNGSNLGISIKRSSSDLFDKNDVPERCVAFLRDASGNNKIGMAGGYSLIDGFTKKSERNNYINDQTTQEVLSYSYGSSSVYNKFYPHAIDGNIFINNVMPASFVKDFCCYYAWFNPNDNEENVFAYVYKATDCYVVYIHAFIESDKVAVLLPAYLEGKKFDSMIEKTDGATLLTNVVSCNKLYCKFESFGSSNERTDNYLVFKVK